MKINKVMVLISVILLFSSCARTLSVFKAEGKSKNRLKGIPFYAHKGEIQQQTMYLYKWQELILQRQIIGQSSVETIAKARTVDEQEIEQLLTLISELNSNDSKESEVDPIINRINLLNGTSILANESIKSGKKDVIQNQWESPKSPYVSLAFAVIVALILQAY